MILLMATDMDSLSYIWMLGSARDQTAYAIVALYNHKIGKFILPRHAVAI